MPRSPEVQAASVILRGHFTPAIFQPSWFASQGLLRKSEADGAEIQIIHPKAAVFSTAWLQMQVLEDRFGASTTQAPYFEALRELAQGVFKILDQTPVRALGINQSFHFLLGSEEKWHQVGHKLAPKDLWNSILAKPGMESLTIQGVRPDKYEGYINVKVEPSRRHRPGVFIEINDHYQLATTEEIQPGTDTLLSILNSNWQESMERGNTISQSILGVGDS